jgi:O-antigen ligase
MFLIYYSGSRIGLLISLITLLTFTIFLNNYKKILIVFFLVLIPSFIVILINPRVKETYSKINSSETDKGSNKPTNESLVRLDIWKASFEIIKANPILGHGTGSEKKKLIKKYIDNKCLICEQQKFNSHNYYFSLLIQLGLLGLTPFLLAVTVGLINALKTLNFSLLTIIFANCTYLLIESGLNRYNGLILFLFFILFEFTGEEGNKKLVFLKKKLKK